MSRPEDKGSELFGMNLFEHATKREQEEQECLWIIRSGRKFPTRQPEYRFWGTEEDAKSAAKSLMGTYEREKLKHEK